MLPQIIRFDFTLFHGHNHIPFLLDLLGSLSTVVGDKKLTSKEDLSGPLFKYVQSDEDTFPLVPSNFSFE